MEYRADCLHFRGHVPCTPHKREGVHCAGCPRYVQREGRILLIKLGAAGDVVRTTPLLEPLRRDFPRHALTWLTYVPELVPAEVEDRLRLDVAATVWLRSTRFDLAINLDKDREACALLRQIEAPRKIGFTLGDDGLCRPVDSSLCRPVDPQPARDKYLTGLFDDVNQACRLSYPQEIFAICGYEFHGEEYRLDRPATANLPLGDLPAARPLIGLNTGCGGRWTSRLWPERHWEALARELAGAGYGVLLLGGAAEDDRNRRLARTTGAGYLGHFPLSDFIGLVDCCDVVVTGVTMALHLAIGLRKQVVALNNIFNRHEFELYGRGVLLEPEEPCRCFFQPTCTAERFCLETLSPDKVLAAVRGLARS
jgi:heptosyltransferase-2